jgi:sirohydrochlorin ferrochelatase
VTAIPAPALIGCAHGTRSPAGRRAVGALIAEVRSARPGLVVRAAFVDVHPPAVADVVDAVTGPTARAVVVPLLLSTGYHVGVDIAAAVAGRPALGPDRRLVDVLLDRLRAADLSADDAVVIAAAGSSDPRAAIDVAGIAGSVQRHHPGPVTVGYCAGTTPRVPDAVAAARSADPGRRVLVAAYLLAPGFFHDRLQQAGADAVTAPLLDATTGTATGTTTGTTTGTATGTATGAALAETDRISGPPSGPERARPDPRLVSLILARYDAACSGWSAPGPRTAT